eukprot:6212499-Pleurochrysis_carterae.AAC.1
MRIRARASTCVSSRRARFSKATLACHARAETSQSRRLDGRPRTESVSLKPPRPTKRGREICMNEAWHRREKSGKQA